MKLEKINIVEKMILFLKSYENKLSFSVLYGT